MKTFTLPISPSYVAEWGLWEAVRELYQNALDQKQLTRCMAEISHSDGYLNIVASSGQLEPRSLILGNSTKAEDPSLRGKFGEGYKLALLVLCRLGFEVTIFNGDFIWVPSIVHSEEYESDVLQVTINRIANEEDAQAGTDFRIKGVTDEQWADIQRNIRDTPETNLILHDAEETGRIYVGGLYVCTNPEFKCGYSFLPDTFPLDRDRQMVGSYDLSMVTGRLWANEEERDGAVGMLDDDAADVRYTYYHSCYSSPVVAKVTTAYYKKHGAETVPVTTQLEIENATRAGLKWALVPAGVMAILKKARSWLIPTTKTPVERLSDFYKSNYTCLNREAREELQDIIKLMTPAT